MHELTVGKGRCIVEGEKVAVLTIGHIGNEAAKAVERLETEGATVGHYDMRFVKPLDTGLLDAVAARYSAVVTVEDGCLQGGFGSAVIEHYEQRRNEGQKVPFVARLGLPDEFVTHGSVPQLRSDCHIDAESIYATIKSLL